LKIFIYYLCTIVACFYGETLSASAHDSPNLSMAEVQWVICEPSESALFQKLGLPLPNPSLREVYYSDTLALDIFHRGGILRTRVSKDKAKTSAKIRPATEAAIPWAFFAGKDYKCEYDAYSTGQSIGCSLYFTPKGHGPLRSEDQEFMIAKQTGFSDFAALRLIGPAHSAEWEWSDSETRESLVLESMRAPKGFFSLELSTRVPRERKSEVAEKVSRWLLRHGVQACSVQKGKTEELLNAFVK
jgi:hypothetical protein